jgi:hypothetical protein
MHHCQSHPIDGPLVTLDQEMLQRGPADVTRLTPHDWLQGEAS